MVALTVKVKSGNTEGTEEHEEHREKDRCPRIATRPIGTNKFTQEVEAALVMVPATMRRTDLTGLEDLSGLWPEP